MPTHQHRGAAPAVGRVTDAPLHPGRRLGATIALTHFIAVLYSHLLVLFAQPRPVWLPGTAFLFTMTFIYFVPFAFWNNSTLARAGDDADVEIPAWGTLAIRIVQGYAIVIFFLLMGMAIDGRIEKRPDGYFRVPKGDSPAMEVSAEVYQRFKAREGALFSAWPMAFAFPAFVMLAFAKYPPPAPRTYRWNCLVCDQGNEPGSDRCEQCGCPSDAKLPDIERRRALRQAPSP